MRGIILAGGTGSRLLPLTATTSKQLLPVYDKPLIYHPLSTLMLSGIRDILVITRPDQIHNFKKLLQDGSQLGVSISYLAQPQPKGIAHAITLSEDFINGEPFALILGDNIFHGPGLGRHLQKYTKPTGANIFAYKVANPEDYGVVTLSKQGKPTKIEEKPKDPESRYAVTGLYYFSPKAVSIAKKLNPSHRGERVGDPMDVALTQGWLIKE